MSSVAIIGANGQLGTDLCKVFVAKGWEVRPISHTQMQVEDIDSVSETLRLNPADWIINTAAFHKVDECEKDSGKAWLINATGPANVARVANDLGVKSVFISSDYVFSGNLEKELSYAENDLVSPQNAYGHSKAGGEAVTLAANPKNLVIRISSVFGCAGSSGKGGNFVETILNKARAGQDLKVVDDINMSPTYTVDAAEKILAALSESLSGVLHASNSDSTSWFGFARKILELSGFQTELVATETDWSLPLKRPRNSALDVHQAEAIMGFTTPWEDGLRRYLIEKGYI